MPNESKTLKCGKEQKGNYKRLLSEPPSVQRPYYLLQAKGQNFKRTFRIIKSPKGEFIQTASTKSLTKHGAEVIHEWTKLYYGKSDKCSWATTLIVALAEVEVYNLCHELQNGKPYDPAILGNLTDEHKRRITHATIIGAI